MRLTRTLALFVALATTCALVVGASPANAVYQREPVSLAWHPAGPVHSSVAAGGVVYLGGLLNGTGGIAAVDAGTGALLWQMPTDDDVRALALSADGSTLYAGGQFTTVDGVTHKRVVAINTSDHSLVSTFKGSAPGGVRDLAVHGSNLYVGGRITTNANGGIVGGVESLNAATGAKDPSFSISVNNDVLGLAVAGNRLIVSGRFTQVNGSARNELASIDLTTNSLQSWAPAKLCTTCDQYWDVQTDGTNAYVATSGNAGGAFNLTTGLPAWSTIRGTGDFQAVWLPGDGRVYYGGHFGAGVWSQGNPGLKVDAARMLVSVSIANGLPQPDWTPYLYTSYPGVWCFASTPGKLWVGGNFTGEQVNGTNNKQPYIAAYPTAGSVDTQPPSGTYTTNPTSASTGATVHVVQQAIHDNVTPDNQIQRMVDWGDGSPVEHWTSGTTLGHAYQKAGTFTPKVTLTDQAGNTSAPISASAVTVTVSADTQPPTGSFTTDPGSAWAGLDKVEVVQSAISDNVTPDSQIQRMVDWGDGTRQAWTSGATLAHVYRSGGSFTPKVTLTDQAGNSASVDSTAVAVRVDSSAPAVRVTVPARRHHVMSWRPVRGTARDAGTGVTTVSMKVVQKRGSSWYAYRASSHSWVKASTRAKALARGTTIHVHVNGKHRWHTKLAHLRQGRLVVQAWAQDQVKNRSATVTNRVNLNRH
jgi:PKD domain-containing protein